MRKWCLPLTYKPKIDGVRNGTIRQTIRMGTKYHAGDMVMFHGWAGRPYYSSWDFRTEYFELLEIQNCISTDDGIIIRGVDTLQSNPLIYSTGLKLWGDCDQIAELDGIDPPTGQALRDALIGRNGNIDGKTAQILRW